VNWIVVTSEDEVLNGRIRIFGKRNHHIQSILNKKILDTLRVILPSREKGIYQIQNITEDYVEILPLELEGLNGTSFPSMEVIFALPRPQTGKKILYLCGLYGIRTINFVFPHMKNKEYLTSPLYLGGEKMEIFDGMSQSGNPNPTEVIYTKSISAFFTSLNKKNTIVFDPSGLSYVNMSDTVCKLLKNEEHLKFVFGPESGFTKEELERFRDLEIPIANLGRVILRTEYAFHAFLHQTNTWLETNSA
jgi:RsmE family RNA methyltransferase